MRPTALFKRSFLLPAVLVVMLAASALLAVSAQASRYAPESDDASAEVQEWTLDQFTVRTQLLSEEEAFGPGVVYHFLRNGQELFEPVEATIFEPQVRGPLADTPWPGCSALWTTTYSGGAHCCFEDIVLISCPDRDVVVRISLGDSDAGDLTKKGKLAALPLTDWGMSYYAPDPDKDLFLPFASSPAFGRFLVFAPEGPRPDRPGEFPGFHANQRAEAERDADDDLPTMAMMAAYHAYMVNGDKEAARQVLKKHLREPWLSVADVVLEDVVKAADGFDPAKVQVFSKP